MALLQNVVAKGTHAARPSAGSAGVLYYETDTYGLFRDNGTTWDQIAWPSSPPAVRCYNSANQSISSGVLTALSFDTNRYDLGTATAQHSTSSNTSRLVCQVAGVYLIAGAVGCDNSPNGGRYASIRLNGSAELCRQAIPTSASGFNTYFTPTTTWLLAVGDYVELCVFQNSGGNLNFWGGGASSAEFMMARVA